MFLCFRLFLFHCRGWTRISYLDTMVTVTTTTWSLCMISSSTASMAWGVERGTEIVYPGYLKFPTIPCKVMWRATTCTSSKYKFQLRWEVCSLMRKLCHSSLPPIDSCIQLQANALTLDWRRRWRENGRNWRRLNAVETIPHCTLSLTGRLLTLPQWYNHYILPHTHSSPPKGTQVFPRATPRHLSSHLHPHKIHKDLHFRGSPLTARPEVVDPRLFKKLAATV